MSTQSDTTKATQASDEWRNRSSKKRSRKRPFIIESCYVGNSAWASKHWGNWRKESAYETRKQRDQALEQVKKSRAILGFEYRAVDL